MADVSMEQLPKRVRDAFEKAATAVERNNLDYAIDMLTSLLDQEPKVFGWVSGDEQALLKKHGIV